MPRLAALVLFTVVIRPATFGTIDPDDQSAQDPSVTVRDIPPAEAEWPAPPERILIAEKVPLELPNGQTLVLLDHKSGDHRVRYKVDGIEYKPRVGTTVALPGRDFVVLVTCTRSRLPKKLSGRDSAEFQIECVPRPAPPGRTDAGPRSPTSDSRPLPSESDAVAPPAPPASTPQPPGPPVVPPRYRPQPPVEPRALPGPHFVILAEKRPFRLPNGRWLVLKDHKVGDCQIRYEVDGLEYWPAVGETLVFPGPRCFVHVTCTRWKLPKKYFGRDSAEFLIESFPAP